MKNVFVVCQHGNEKTPLRVIQDNFKNRIDYILANKEAFRLNKRFIHTDLNRSFPGLESGSREEKIAKDLIIKLNKYEQVFDLHTTTSDSPIFIITISTGQKHLDLINSLNISKVVYMKKSIAKGNSLIDHVKLGVSIEAGSEGSLKTYDEYKKFINDLLNNVEGNRKDFYEVFAVITKDKDEILSKEIKSFKLVRKGELISNMGGIERKAEFDFYPIMPGERSYKNVLTLAAKKINFLS